MDDKLGGTWSYKTMISLCDISQARQIQRQIFFQEKIRFNTKEDNKNVQMLKKEL